MHHLVLLGDSIFDNGSYVQPGEPAVIQQVETKLPDVWSASLSAVDGNYVSDISTQLFSMPLNATHLAVSAGGNDALDEAKILTDPATSVGEALNKLAGVTERFRNSYREMLQILLRQGLPTVLCTIYEGNMPDPTYRRLTSTALQLFNDCILREAIAAQLPVLDLRLVCNQPGDYANPIEPSALGGGKIAAGLVKVMTTHDFSSPQCRIYF